MLWRVANVDEMEAFINKKFEELCCYTPEDSEEKNEEHPLLT